MSVWVVDDSRLIRSMLTALLTQAGISGVQTADSGEGLLEALQNPVTRDQVRLILLDLMMPGMDGIQTLKHLRDYPELHDIPVIIITGRDEKEDLEAAFQAGASDFLSKPADPVEFVARVKGALRLSELLVQRRSRERDLKDSHARLELLTYTDALTGIANRRSFDQALQKLWTGPERTVSLILLDVDHFKRYNDTLGHLEGDACLKRVAAALEDTLKEEGIFIPEALLARYGGEEFAVLLPDASLDEAMQLAEHLRLGVLAAAIDHPHSDHHHLVTISLGVQTLRTGPETTPALLIEQADQALYQAKKSGRNQVFRADQLHPMTPEPDGDALSLHRWHKVMVVDDSAVARAFLRQAFQREGAEVVEASSVPQALEHLPQIGEFDLIMLDMHLHDSSGLEVLQKVRQVNQSVVVVIFSGKHSRSMQEALKLGADAYLSKSDFDLQGKDLSAFMQALHHARECRLGVLAREVLKQVQTDFFSVFAHDLKNPIAALGLAIDLAAETQHPDDLAPLLSGALEAKSMLLEVLAQYQEYMRLEAGQLELDLAPVSLQSVVKACLQDLQKQAQFRGQKLIFEKEMEDATPQDSEVLIDARVFGDALHSALISLMKHAPDEGTIRVRLERTAEQVRLVLEEEESRIPADEIQLLLHNPRMAHKWFGSGVSLPLMRAVLAAHHGRLWAESSNGSSRFLAELPLLGQVDLA
ncbi:response regulator [Deinococcus cellulosilyticus]|uniref:Response regulator receiver modulated diguanylate cyclase n=1 Tax=Deinococcus cellulosilyticus (strain DSM 18568 / NBRC 106333 / KACC 11606 / 5516J-15) TaxID=1223518 RepID=A0A511MUW0_DEIC1|nr:response regulator [Deinococcus cellulosilyticus]GEM44379.1 hypothetical protein DC3_00140 [Deinococcus cellulosilyticus NBRC 106333 = KACC 11606]